VTDCGIIEDWPAGLWRYGVAFSQAGKRGAILLNWCFKPDTLDLFAELKVYVGGYENEGSRGWGQRCQLLRDQVLTIRWWSGAATAAIMHGRKGL